MPQTNPEGAQSNTGGFSKNVDELVRALRLQNIFRLFATPFPKIAKEGIKKMLLHAGVTEDESDWLGSVLFLAIETAIIAFMFLWIILRIPQLEVLYAAAAISAALVPFAAYSLLFLQIEDRKNRLETNLPYMLRMVAANIRGGMSSLVALRTSARPEFGPLSDEIKIATSKALGTESFETVLNEMSVKFDSEVFARTVSLFSASLRSGGNLAQLLENAAEDLQESREMKIELETSTRTYILFILFVVIAATPLLLSVSLQFTETLTRLIEQPRPYAVETGGAYIRLPFTRDFLFQASLATIASTAILASLLVGVIREGKWLSGAKYAPAILAASIAVFLALQKYAITALFQTT